MALGSPSSQGGLACGSAGIVMLVSEATSLPRYQDLISPTLDALREEGAAMGIALIVHRVAESLKLTVEQRELQHPEGPMTELEYRIRRALKDLVGMRAVRRTWRIRQWSVTEQGLSLADDEIVGVRTAYMVRGRRVLSDVATWTSWLGVLVAVGAAAIAAYQAHVTSLQNQDAEQQSLTEIVTDISKDVTAFGSAHGESVHTLAQALTADATQGAELIDQLPRRTAPAIDSFEVALAFENVGDDADAVHWFAWAASTPGAPDYPSFAMEDEGRILYEIGGKDNDNAAESDMQAAVRLWEKAADVTAAQIAYEVAYAQLDDVRYGAQADCSRAQAELKSAVRREAMMSAPDLEVIATTYFPPARQAFEEHC